MEALESSPKKLTIANSPQRNMALHVSPKKEYSDRFIPTRSAYDLDTNDLFFVKEEEPSKTENLKEENSITYQMLLRNELLGTPFKNINANTSSNSPTKPSPSPKKTNMFKFKIDKSEPIDSPYSLSPISSESQKILSSPRKPPRKIQKNAVKVLEAPAIQDDFYLNLVDWSSQNTLAVGLGSCVFLWNASTSHVSKLVDLGSSDAVTSVSWTQRGTHLAVGTNKGMVQLWDISHNKVIRNMAGHKSRVGSVAWNGPLLSSGSRDRVILHRDVREPIDYNARLVGHKQEVCGLKWSYDGTQLASGGNDNKLLLWDARNTAPIAKFADHVAAVKAIAWSPHQRGLLASGGGTADRCIRSWNTLTHTPISKLDTGSQVCNLAWSENVNELVSTHGYSQNQIVVWSYPTMNQIATLTGHSMRVLYLAVSPDGQTIITGAGDETLRLWNVFPPKPSASKTSFLQFKNEIR